MTDDAFHPILDHIHDVLFLIDVESDERYRFVSVNRSFLEATGLQESQVVGKLIQEVIPEPAHELVLGKYRQAIAERRAVHWTEVSVYPAGEKTGEVTVVPVFDAKGNCSLVGTVHDITEHVLAKNKLSELNEQLAHVLNAMREGFVTFDTDMTVTFINTNGAEMLGRKPEDLIGKNYWEAFPEAKASAYSETFVQSLQNQTPMTFEGRLDSKDRWFENRIYPSEDGLALFFWDISKRKQNERKLQQMTRLYSALSECNQVIVRCHSESELFTETCRIAVEFGGLSMAWVGRERESDHMVKPIASFGSGIEYIHDINISTEADSPYGNGPVGTAMRTHQPVWCHDFQNHPALVPWRSVGKRFGWGSVASLPLYCKGKIAGSLNLYSEDMHYFDDQMQKLVIEMSEDIGYALGRFFDEAERSKEQAQLHMLSEALNQSPSVIIMTDLSGTIEYVNSAFTMRYGYESQEVIGKPIHFLLQGESSREFFESIQTNLVREGKWYGEIGSVAKDGREYTEQATVAIVCSPDDQPIKQVYAFRDITDQKRSEREQQRLQAQLQHALKMDSIGRLAGGIAHDFNNMLGVIIAYSDLSLRQVTDESELHGFLREISNAANRSAELTRHLLTFARKQIYTPKVLEPNKAVSVMIKMLQRMIGEDVELVWKPGDDVWQVYIDPSQLDQILANLSVNARDAIGEDGRITIETSNESLDDDFCVRHPGLMPGDYVRLSVSDNGCGIEKEDFSNIFEPFFTTKSVGEGTGLGLSTVYGIVEQNRGCIDVYSEPGHGTTFNIYFPRHSASPLVAKKDMEANEFAQGHERILLVEDEAAILEVIRSALDNCGYLIMPARSPEEAIRMAEECQEDIHMLITDIIMPGMNGHSLAQRLLSIHPELKCLYISGYSGDIISNLDMTEEKINFIQKPFSMAKLTERVREILDS